jgi:hypothetical protein
MRDHGVPVLTIGSVTIHLGPDPKAERTRVTNDPNHVRRAHYEMTYGRPVTDEELAKLP